ncbi:MAG: helix-turn-helix transcriptional regulator [Patescibacteria group bacterium]
MDFKKYFEQQNISLTDKERIAVKVGGLITAARLYARLSQKELAEKIGTQQPSVARAEKGEVIASVEFLDKIARAIKTELILRFSFMEEKIKTQTVENSIDVSHSSSGFVVSPLSGSYQILFK